MRLMLKEMKNRKWDVYGIVGNWGDTLAVLGRRVLSRILFFYFFLFFLRKVKHSNKSKIIETLLV